MGDSIILKEMNNINLTREELIELFMNSNKPRFNVYGETPLGLDALSADAFDFLALFTQPDSGMLVSDFVDAYLERTSAGS